MKQWLIIAGLLLLLFIGGYFAFTKLIVPKAAEAFVPAKWRNIPLGQKRSVVHDYLGTPVASGNNHEIWRHNLNKSKAYVLVIGYANDSIAKRYRVSYEVEALGYESTTELAVDSMPF